MIAIIDYGAGNIRSIENAVKKLGQSTIVTSNLSDLASAEKIILPGVGAFACTENLGKLKKSIIDEIKKGKPILGICLGMQMLFEESEESPGIRGLAVFKGNVRKLRSDCLTSGCLKLPQIGWNSIKQTAESPLLKGITTEDYFYFVNSYVVDPVDRSIVAATSEYGETFCSVVSSGNIFGTQFHPEKSGKVGLKLIQNFIEL
ncbi:imidazole glycerol phosphate synthase subunit HisH [Candidatus Micrarchaeota archaeon]|nr:imidazole glycerol phosphate synthase subunit HisH [Candidatus Micrarchaeota archaeon]